MATLSVTQKSQLFSVYNKARACGLDRPRVNRAMGIIQAGRAKLLADGSAAVENEDGTVYMVKGKSCTCPDHRFRGETCKHIVASWLLVRMAEQAPKPAPVAPVVEQTVDEAIALLWGVA